MTFIEIFTTRTCGYCFSAKRLLNSYNSVFKEVDVSSNMDNRNKMVSRSKGLTSVPQIFIDKVHIGGFDELYKLHQKGSLTKLIER